MSSSYATNELYSLNCLHDVGWSVSKVVPSALPKEAMGPKDCPIRRCQDHFSYWSRHLLRASRSRRYSAVDSVPHIRNPSRLKSLFPTNSNELYTILRSAVRDVAGQVSRCHIKRHSSVSSMLRSVDTNAGMREVALWSCCEGAQTCPSVIMLHPTFSSLLCSLRKHLLNSFRTF